MASKHEVVYPAPTGEPGAPFTDPNFKLVVLDALITSGAIQLGSHGELAAHLLGTDYDEERDGYELQQPVYDYLVRYPLAPADLGAVEQLTFDGGNAVYFYPFRFWDGESDEYDVTGLEGIGHLRNLRQIDVISMLDKADLAPLAFLAKLEHLDLGHGSFTNARALLQLPALQTLRCAARTLSDPDLVETLRKRGVDVQVS